MKAKWKVSKDQRRLMQTVAKQGSFTMPFVEEVLRLYFVTVRDEVWQRGKLWISEIGTFRIKVRKAREVTPPPGATASEPITLPPHEVVTFRASKNWRTR